MPSISIGVVIVSTWSAFDIVESELGNARVELHKQGQRLSDTASTAEDGNLGGLQLIRSAF